MISTSRFKGHALSSIGSKRSHTSIPTLERRSSRSEIRPDITLRQVRSLRAKRASQQKVAGAPRDSTSPSESVSRSFEFWVTNALAVTVGLLATRTYWDLAGHRGGCSLTGDLVWRS